MKVLLSMLSIIFLTSCAHYGMSEGKHHLHKCTKNCEMHSDKGEVFNKHCAMSLAMGNADVIGEKDLKINHEGEIYYFSTEEKMKTFKNNIKENISNARSNWSAALERR